MESPSQTSNEFPRGKGRKRRGNKRLGGGDGLVGNENVKIPKLSRIRIQNQNKGDNARTEREDGESFNLVPLPRVRPSSAPVSAAPLKKVSNPVDGTSLGKNAPAAVVAASPKPSRGRGRPRKLVRPPSPILITLDSDSGDESQDGHGNAPRAASATIVTPILDADGNMEEERKNLKDVDVLLLPHEAKRSADAEASHLQCATIVAATPKEYTFDDSSYDYLILQPEIDPNAGQMQSFYFIPQGEVKKESRDTSEADAEQAFNSFDFVTLDDTELELPRGIVNVILAISDNEVKVEKDLPSDLNETERDSSELEPDVSPIVETETEKSLETGTQVQPTTNILYVEPMVNFKLEIETQEKLPDGNEVEQNRAAGLVTIEEESEDDGSSDKEDLKEKDSSKTKSMVNTGAGNSNSTQFATIEDTASVQPLSHESPCRNEAGSSNATVGAPLTANKQESPDTSSMTDEELSEEDEEGIPRGLGKKLGEEPLLIFNWTDDETEEHDEEIPKSELELEDAAAKRDCDLFWPFRSVWNFAKRRLSTDNGKI